MFKTRSLAAAACAGGKVDLNAQAAKPAKLVRPGDLLRITVGPARRVLRVTGLGDRRGPPSAARMLYEDLTPKPTAEEIEMRRIERMHRAAMTPPRAPDKRARRALRRLKEGND